MHSQNQNGTLMMLSRIADSLFWLNRYMERTDGILRSLRYFYILGFDSYGGYSFNYKPLLQCYTGLSDTAIDEMSTDTSQVLRYMITDTSNINSMRVLLSKARENARGSQDKITKEVWEQVNAMFHYINKGGLDKKLDGDEALHVMDQLEKHCLMYNGIVDSTMPRGQGWEFMNVGKFIERCLQTVDLLDAYLQPIEYDLAKNDDLVYWRSLLFSLSGYELYLKSNRGSQHTRQVIYQVMFNADFPRSVIYSLSRMQRYLMELLEQNALASTVILEKKFGRMKSMVEFTDPASMDGQYLEHLLKEVRQQVWDFSSDFQKLFFSYT